jgi:hypothetical protein
LERKIHHINFKRYSFFEGGFLPIFGAVLAGAVIYLAWKTDRLKFFVNPVFTGKLSKKNVKFLQH